MSVPKSEVILPTIPTPTLITSNVPSIEDLKAKIPLLQKMKQDDPRFKTLIGLLQEMASSSYDPAKKYRMMFKIIEIGNLFEILAKEIAVTNPKPLEVVKTCKNDVALGDLNLNQQLSLFQLARFIPADNFHAMYEDQAKALVDNFIRLCNGRCISETLINIDAIFYPLTTGKKIKKILYEGNKGKSVNKLFCQMGYYLKKAEDFIKMGNHEAAAMALIAAGNCGRNYNITGLNPVKKDSVTAELYGLRTKYAHIYSDEKDEQTLSERLRKLVESGQIAQQINQIKEEAKHMGNPVDIDTYYSQKESSSASESPKAYTKDVLRDPASTVVTNAPTLTSLINPPSSSPQLPKEKYIPSSRPSESRTSEKDEPKRGDRERHSSSSRGIPSSRGYSEHQSYDERHREKEREWSPLRERESRREREREKSPVRERERESYRERDRERSPTREREREREPRFGREREDTRGTKHEREEESRREKRREEERKSKLPKRSGGETETKDELRYKKRDRSPDKDDPSGLSRQNPPPQLSTPSSSGTRKDEKESSAPRQGQLKEPIRKKSRI